MNKMLRWLVMSQSIAVMGSSLVFPFYLIFIKDIGGNFSQLGLSFGLFTLSSALFHRWIGSGSDRWGRKPVLLISSWGMALAFLMFPLVTHVNQIYVLQIVMGLLGAMQKTGEKAMLADVTDGQERGKIIGSYHFMTSVFAGFAVMLGGVFIDFFTLDIIFYIGSVMMLLSGFLMLRVQEKTRGNGG